MAAPRFSVSTGKVSTGTLAAGAAKTLILLNPVTNGAQIIEAWVSFGALADQAEILVQLCRVTTLGSPAGTTATVVKDDPVSAASDMTGLVDLTTEPTTYEVLRNLGYVAVQKGLLPWAWPLQREPMVAGAGARLGLRIVNDGTATMVAASCRSTLVWDI